MNHITSTIFLVQKQTNLQYRYYPSANSHVKADACLANTRTDRYEFERRNIGHTERFLISTRSTSQKITLQNTEVFYLGNY